MPVPSLTYSIVVLTFNRNALLERLLKDLGALRRPSVEIIVVDNASSTPASHVTQLHENVRLITAGHNMGAAGRNLGFEAAGGEIVICLDDDVFGLSPDVFERLDEAFAGPVVGAVNFKVLEENSGRVVNWVHHRSVEEFADRTFETYEITEGAVALRRSVLKLTGGYPESFFISHEGPDLAFRIMNRGFSVIYTPNICVTHTFAVEGRASWRNYYYDTRNTLWLAARNLPFLYGLRITLRQTLAMLVYSLRDGYVTWWLKGVWHGLRGLRAASGERSALRPEVMRKVREIDEFRPSLVYLLKRRLFAPVMRL